MDENQIQRANVMRVGLIWNRDDPHVKTTVRYERYMRGFRALGHDPVAVCSRSGAEGFQETLVAADALDCFADPAWWGRLQLDAAVVITYLRFAPLLRALKQSCPWVASIADSDGQVSPRIHPSVTFFQSVLQHRGWLTRGRAAKFWLQRYLSGAGNHDEERIDSAGLADVIAICSPGAREHLSALFRGRRRPDLAGRVAVIPYPVDECYLQGAVPETRARRLVAIGRWDDPQKDASLLTAAIRRTLAVDKEIGFDLVGGGGDAVFAELLRRNPRVVYHGVRPPEAVAELLRGSRSLLLSSRWESGPIVANEALSLGCTLIGPDRVPTFDAYCRDGRYGTACRGGSPRALAAALLDEMRAWDDGKRDPIGIAAAWRPRFDPRTVCRQLLKPVDMTCE